MNMEYFLSRIKREWNFEEWNYYIVEDGELLRRDKVLLFFNEDKCTIYIVTNEYIQDDDYVYYNHIIGLIKDIGYDDELDEDIEIKHAYVERTGDVDLDMENIDEIALEVKQKERTKFS